MADAVLDLLVDNFTQLLKENIQLISGLKDDVNKLLEDLGDFKAFLSQVAKVHNDNAIIKHLIFKIRNVVDDADDLVDKYVVAAKSHYGKKWKRHLDCKHKGRKLRLANDIQKVLSNIKKIRDDQTYNKVLLGAVAQTAARRSEDPLVEEEYVVGFNEEAGAIIHRLIRGPEKHEVISIVGMPGLGKTTLANKVFKDAEVKDYFLNCAWVYVSQVYKRRDIFVKLFTELIKNSKNPPDRKINKDLHRMSGMNDRDILEKIKVILGSDNYFIVMDDVWTTDQWDELKTAFPKNKGSRVLVSTRDNIVARHANSKGDPHTLKFLTDDESWELLQKQVFGEESCADKLKEQHGKSIAKNCDGLPLAILTMAVKLKPCAAWDQVAEAKNDFFRTEKNSHEKLIRISYNPLPYELKNCFLYFGAFPKGYEISAEKLIRLWIAEGFIGEEAGDLTWEGRAHEKLSDLVNKNLVMATQTKPNGQIKTCRVHNMLHEFCKNEVKDENIFEENINQIQIKQLESCRRLGVQCDVAEFFSTYKAAEKVRSLLCFYSDKYELPEDKVPLIRKAFPLLRVLHTTPGEYIILTCFPKRVAKFQLFHLRYIAISTTLNILPQAIDSLWNMQTLIVWTTQSTLNIKGDIWQMTQLRHLQTNSPAQLLPPSPSKKTKNHTSLNRNLQTLSRISLESCTAAALAKAPNLNKLGIQGNLVKLFETNQDTGSSLFKNLGELKLLEKLKLLNDGGKLQCLPQKNEFPGKIKKLTLSNTQLEWSELSVLGSLDKLEILNLIENAFKGQEWEPSIGGFPRLQFLRIDETDLKSWKASNLHFPLLKTLILKKCLQLDDVPPGLANIDHLQELELNQTNQGAIKSAQNILQIKQGKEKELKEKGGSPQRFNLRIITESSN